MNGRRRSRNWRLSKRGKNTSFLPDISSWPMCSNMACENFIFDCWHTQTKSQTITAACGFFTEILVLLNCRILCLWKPVSCCLKLFVIYSHIPIHAGYGWGPSGTGSQFRSPDWCECRNILCYEKSQRCRWYPEQVLISQAIYQFYLQFFFSCYHLPPCLLVFEGVILIKENIVLNLTSLPSWM